MYETSSYTGLNNALEKLKDFIDSLTAWTVDDFDDDATKYAGDTFTGKRLHVHRGDEYFNFRSARNQQVFQGSTVQTLGIAMNGSRGYNGALTWDYQTGAILNASSQSIGGHCNAMMEGGGVYHFFADAEEKSVTACFESSYPNAFTKMTFGVLSNGWQIFAANDLNTTLTFLFTHITSSQQTTCNFSKAVFNPTLSLWTTGQDGATPGVNTLRSALTTTANTDGVLRYARNTVIYSPSPLTGNPVMIPSHFSWFNNSSQYQYLGVIPDVNITSMRYYDNAQEITMPNSDVYIVFNNNYSDTSLSGKGAGVAIKKVI
jgi:hypothetical protein